MYLRIYIQYLGYGCIKSQHIFHRLCISHVFPCCVGETITRYYKK